MIITPITPPAARALSAETSWPIESPTDFKNGPTVRAAKNPYTTVWIPAKISIVGLAYALNFLEPYSEI